MAAQPKSAFYCSKCAARLFKMDTRCPSCRAWNTVKEGIPDTMSTEVVRLVDVDPDSSIKVSTGMKELDDVLGGGTVAGQVVLIGGEPGAGKSTLLLEVADAMTKKNVIDIQTGKNIRKKKNAVLYGTSEEEITAIRARNLRLGRGDQVLVCHNKVISELEADFAEHQPEFGIIDSLSMMDGSQTIQGQVDNMKRIVDVAKGMLMTTFVTIHIVKDGDLAGAKALEHMVDTVLMLTQDQKTSYTRQLRATKNRQGSEDYVGLFEMTSKGLYPFDASTLIDGKIMAPGQAFAVTAMGARSMLVEVQALVTSCGERAKGSITVIGYDAGRVKTLLAVLGKRTSLDTEGMDVYVTVIGGVNFADPSLDAAVAMAIGSAVRNKKLPAKTAFAGEVDLLGCVKAGARLDQREGTAAKHGFRLCSADTLSELLEEGGIE